MIERIENEIIDIATEVSGKAGAYPDNPSSYRPLGVGGEVLVRYLGSRYGNKSLDGTYQDRTMRYELVLVYRNLRDKGKASQGGYAVLERLRDKLFSCRLSQATNVCQIESDEFVAEHNGVWQYSLTISFNSIAFANGQPHTEEILLKNVNSYDSARS